MVFLSGYLYISNDKGVTWNAPSSINPNMWTCVDISSSGKVITAMTYNYDGKYCYESYDGGVTWQSQIINIRLPSSVAIN
jgi:surface antigen